MTKKRLWLVLTIVIATLVFPLAVVSQSAPALNQSAVIVQRDAGAIYPLFKMRIYIDDRKYQTSSRTIFGNIKYEDYDIKLGETVTIPLNDGVHSIFIKMDTVGVESNKIVFTSAQNVKSFLITVDGEGNIVLTAL